MTTEETKAIATWKDAPLELGNSGFELRTLDQCIRYSNMIIKSGLAPKGETLESAVVKLEYGKQLGLSTMASLQNIASINGRPSIWGDALLALVRASGLLEEFSEEYDGTPYDDNYAAICKARRKGDKTPMVEVFTVDDAKRAGLWGKPGPWSQYPKRMLRMRARSFVLRDLFADVLKGCAVYEEQRDMVEAENVVVNGVEQERKPKCESRSASIADRISNAFEAEISEECAVNEESAPAPTPEPENEPQAHENVSDAESDDDSKERAELSDTIDARAKFKGVTFKKFINNAGVDPLKWRMELTIEQLRELNELIQS